MTKSFWRDTPKPIVMLAPMDGYSDSPFRRICRLFNPTLVVVTEFVSSDGLHFAKEKVAQRFRFHPEEQPIVAQIFGNDPANFAEAAKYCEDLGFTGIDLNMGCPARHVVRSEQGVALRSDPDRAARIVATVAAATRLPVSVKTRLGLRDAADLVAFGSLMERAGADLLTIHGRTYADPYGCPADFAPIYELQRQVAIPVVGNGGIVSLADGRKKLGNLAGFMIGQAALGNPWVFSESGVPSLDSRLDFIRQHATWMNEEAGRHGLLRLRKHLIAYTKGLPGAAKFRIRFAHADSLLEIDRVLTELAAAHER